MNVRIHRGEREGRRGIPLYQSWRLPRPGLCLPVIVLAAAFAMMGMSGDANSEPRRLPTPKKNFTATITDESATTTKAELVTCGGKTYLTAYQGKMKMRVPFAKIERVTFHDSDNRYRTARILFWNGEKHELLAKKFLTCSGRTDLGDMFIKVRDLKEVAFDKGPYTETDDKPAAPPAP